MEEFGLPTTFRKFIKVKVMGRQHLFLFEEKPEKEFLGPTRLREGPILEPDEREFWENGIIDEKAKHLWHRWPDYLQLHVKNSEFLKNHVAIGIAMRSLFLV